MKIGVLFLIGTAVLLSAMAAMAQSYPWAMFGPAITGAKWEVVCNVVGSWTRYDDWGCDGVVEYSAVDHILDNSSWWSSDGQWGNWKLVGAHFDLIELSGGLITPIGTYYEGTLNDTCNYVSGEMTDVFNETGCWHAFPSAN